MIPDVQKKYVLQCAEFQLVAAVEARHEAIDCAPWFKAGKLYQIHFLCQNIMNVTTARRGNTKMHCNRNTRKRCTATVDRSCSMFCGVKSRFRSFRMRIPHEVSCAICHEIVTAGPSKSSQIHQKSHDFSSSTLRIRSHWTASTTCAWEPAC